MLSPIKDVSEHGSPAVVLLYEGHNADGGAVITIVASIKPQTGDWSAYWMAFSTGMPQAYRQKLCLINGNKLPEVIAQAMFPEVEERYGVRWRA